MKAANDNLIDRTLRVWQPRLGRDLSREDARLITENMVGFFRVLAAWSHEEMLASTNDNAPLPADATSLADEPERRGR